MTNSVISLVLIGKVFWRGELSFMNKDVGVSLLVTEEENIVGIYEEKHLSRFRASLMFSCPSHSITSQFL